MPLQIVSKEKIFKGKFTSLWSTKFLDKSNKEGVWEWMEKPDAVIIIPITKDGKLVLIKNYRVPIERYCIEFPAGLLDQKGENREDAARRELLEETGYIAEKFIPLRPVANVPASLNNFLYPYVALGAQRVNNNSGDVNEDIEVIEIPCYELFDFYEKCPENVDFSIRIISLYELAKQKGFIPSL